MKNPFINAKIIGRGIDPEIYHQQDGKRGELGFVMSRSELFEFNRCPSRWLAGFRDGGSSSTEYGALLDCLLLDGKRFGNKFAVKPETYTNEKGETKEWNGNATVCRKWKDEQGGKQIVKSEDVTDVKTAIARISKDAVANRLLEESEYQTHVTAIYEDEATGLQIPVKILIDIEPSSESENGCNLADLKSTQSAAHRDWSWSVYKYGYHWQAAMYLDVYNAATGDDRTGFLHIIQESFAPYEIGKRLLSAEYIQFGRAEYLRALARYAQCLASGEWQGYDHENLYNGFSICEPEAKMITA